MPQKLCEHLENPPHETAAGQPQSRHAPAVLPGSAGHRPALRWVQSESTARRSPTGCAGFPMLRVPTARFDHAAAPSRHAGLQSATANRADCDAFVRFLLHWHRNAGAIPRLHDALLHLQTRHGRWAQRPCTPSMQPKHALWGASGKDESACDQALTVGQFCTTVLRVSRLVVTLHSRLFLAVADRFHLGILHAQQIQRTAHGFGTLLTQCQVVLATTTL